MNADREHDDDEDEEPRDLELECELEPDGSPRRFEVPDDDPCQEFLENVAQEPSRPISDEYESPAREALRRIAKVLTVTSISYKGTLFLLNGACIFSCCGATVSAKLEWQERERQIDLAEQQDQKAESAEKADPEELPRE